MLIIGSVTVAVLTIWYMIYTTKSVAKMAKKTRMPLRDWLALYEATNEAMRPAMACALISKACELGVQLKVMDIKLGQFIMSEAKRHDYIVFLNVLLDHCDHYPVDLSRTDESASATILALLGYAISPQKN